MSETVERDWASLLQAELTTYENEKAELLTEHEGKFVLIHGSEVVAVFDDEQDAINEGFKRFGNVPFLVKQILEVDIPVQIASNFLDL